MIFARCLINRGSFKDAEAILLRAADLADALQSAIWTARVAVLLAEMYSDLHRVDDALEQLTKAAEVFEELGGPDQLDVARVHGILEMKRFDHAAAEEAFAAVSRLIEESEAALVTSDAALNTPARAGLSSPVKETAKSDPLMPFTIAGILRQQTRLQYEVGAVEESEVLLKRLHSVAQDSNAMALYQHAAGTLALSKAFSEFEADLFMNSLTESTISIPIGCVASVEETPISKTHTLALLGEAEKAFREYLSITSDQGEVFDTRQASVSRALLHCYQASLGKRADKAVWETASLLGKPV